MGYKIFELGEHVVFNCPMSGATIVKLHCTIVGKGKMERDVYLLQIDDEQYPQCAERWIQKVSVGAFSHISEIDRGRCFASHRDYLRRDNNYYDNLAANQMSIDVLSVL